jgi:hypothetical protein
MDSEVNQLIPIHSAVGQLRAEISLLKVWKLPCSRIVADFPPLFEEFGAKRWTLLWRGSRDGFGAVEFHSRCDGHPNTLTVILDTKGNIFGGFTSVKWESDGDGKDKGDDSLQSFLFTLKNPHSVSPRKFALRREQKQHAIYCCSASGPVFGFNKAIRLNREEVSKSGIVWATDIARELALDAINGGNKLAEFAAGGYRVYYDGLAESVNFVCLVLRLGMEIARTIHKSESVSQQFDAKHKTLMQLLKAEHPGATPSTDLDRYWNGYKLAEKISQLRGVIKTDNLKDFRTHPIAVSNDCNTNSNSFTHLGNLWSDDTYMNDTAVNDFFTGSSNFTVKEIEVFEIAD